MTKYLLSFYIDHGRGGSLDGLFVATEEELQVLADETVYFGEVLGKHSDVQIGFSAHDVDMDIIRTNTRTTNGFSLVDVSPEVIEALEKACGGRTISGYNPLDYFDEEDHDKE